MTNFLDRIKRLPAAIGRGSAGGELSDEEFLRLAYKMILDRDIDDEGLQTRTAALASGKISRDDTLVDLRQSPEMKNLMQGSAGSLHYSRLMFIRSLPAARRILDLGGVDLNDERGAFVTMGYPYPFERLTIVDLPDDDRHPTYRSGDPHDVVQTHSGPVTYQYHSMADLSRYEDDSFDLIYSGQSFEHITVDDGRGLLEQVSRVLAPGGALALDTPNRRATEAQLVGTGEEFVDPDHEVEYHHSELMAMFEAANLRVSRAHGLAYVGGGIARGKVTDEDIAGQPGIYDDIENCYIVAYVVQPA